MTQRGVGEWNVAKKQLVSCVQVLLGEGRLRVAPGLELATVLTREMETFSVKITSAGNETFEAWRERDHDDMVLALALACWAGQTITWPLPADAEHPEALTA